MKNRTFSRVRKDRPLIAYFISIKQFPMGTVSLCSSEFLCLDLVSTALVKILRCVEYAPAERMRRILT